MLNKGGFASDERAADFAFARTHVINLPGVDQEKVSTAIDIVEANIAAFDNGHVPDGWSTELVATLATRICGAEMTSFSAIP